jgi:hypothetical protein
MKILYNELGTLYSPQKFDTLKLLNKNTQTNVRNVVWDLQYKTKRKADVDKE